MSKEKQIKETTELLWHFPKALHLNCYNDCLEVAKLLYEENYHKQSKGKWIAKPQEWYIDATDWMCSNCKTEFSPIDMVGDDFFRMMKYCPNCGAHMRKEDEGK